MGAWTLEAAPMVSEAETAIAFFFSIVGGGERLRGRMREGEGSSLFFFGI
jgi:hypothetical protein